MDNPVCRHCGRAKYEHVVVAGNKFGITYSTDIVDAEVSRARWSMWNDLGTVFDREIELSEPLHDKVMVLSPDKTKDLVGLHRHQIKLYLKTGEIYCSGTRETLFHQPKEN